MATLTSKASFADILAATILGAMCGRGDASLHAIIAGARAVAERLGGAGHKDSRIAVVRASGSTVAARCAEALSAGAPAVLSRFAERAEVRKSGEASMWLAVALRNIACESSDGAAACVSALAPEALIALLRCPAVQGHAGAAQHVAWALTSTFQIEVGFYACLAAGAPQALVGLASSPAVQRDAGATEWVARAIFHLSEHGAGREACVAAGGPAAYVTLARRHAALSG